MPKEFASFRCMKFVIAIDACVAEALERLADVDLIYITFDVDSLIAT